AEVSSAPSHIGEDVALLVVGGPTHAFAMSRAGTRRSAAEDAPEGLVSTDAGIREWLSGLRTGSARLAAAAFDTRVAKPRLPGSAARGAAKRLRRLGVRLAAPAESFYVTGGHGPLVEGEVERARAWGEHLAASFPVPAS